MFTIDQIQAASKKVKTGADFPQLVQDFKAIGITHYDNFVADGHTNYFGANSFVLSSAAKYFPIHIADQSSADMLLHTIRIHQQGQTDYLTFCNQAADAGVEKWITDIVAMNVTYVDKQGMKLLVEPIPKPA